MTAGMEPEIERADGMFEHAVQSRDTAALLEAEKLYAAELARQMRRRRGAKIARCCSRRAQCRLHIAEWGTAGASGRRSPTTIASHLHMAVDDCALGLLHKPRDSTLHHTAGVANDMLGNAQAAQQHFA